MTGKRGRGQFYTAGNPFRHAAFLRWAENAQLPRATVLEPHAGANSLISRLADMSLCRDCASFDIEPGSASVQMMDTLAAEPTARSGPSRRAR